MHVLQAYVDAIARAHHYVHIEQQFFISSTAGGGVRNRVAAALVARIERAVRERAPFRINVVMPLLPSFPGTPQEDFTVHICAFWKCFLLAHSYPYFASRRHACVGFLRVVKDLPLLVF